jgi:hypothetical protein
MGNPFSSRWGKNDVVGCGVDYLTNATFFTLNGEIISKSAVEHLISNMHVSLTTFLYSFP